MINDAASHPQELTVAELLIRYLRLEGVEHVFGIPGRVNEFVLKELSDPENEVDFILCRHETGAAYIADGYSRVTGRLGVVLATSGPGATNALTGSMNAQAGHSAVLTITGEVDQAYYGMGYLQEGVTSKLNLNTIFQNAVEFSAVISHPGNFPTLLQQALRSTLALPHRAAHLCIPRDVSNMTVPQARVPANSSSYRTTPQTIDRDGVEQIFHQLMQARFPLIFIGNGCRMPLWDKQRYQRFIQLVDKFALPVLTTANGKGIFPEAHPMSLRHYGIAAGEWARHYLSTENPSYDALLILGSSLGQLATSGWNQALVPNGPVMQVDVNPAAVGRIYPVQAGVVSNLENFFDLLCTLGEQATPDAEVIQARCALLEQIKSQHSPYREPQAITSMVAPIHPAALVTTLSDLLPAGSHVFVDAGNCVGWALHYLTINPPTQCHSALAMGPMGFGANAVIGGKLGAPETTCISLVGDGAFLMNGSEVSTAARYGIGAIWVVLNDDDHGMVSQGMNYDFKSERWTHHYTLGNPDLVQWSEALGATAYLVQDVGEMQTAFTTALEQAATGKPQVIIARIDRQAIPPYYPPRTT